ncbi:response regulator [Aestuariibius insulae]|uniref:response regulator n=1 Tax=Aestuariibius insulae TaxID=2058287 RepID=UPI00345EDD39
MSLQIAMLLETEEGFAVKVLHVDDENDIREIVALALEMDGDWEVATATSGAEALDLMASDRPEIILLDVMMPSMSGPELKKQMDCDPDLRGIPVIFMTAAAQEQTRAELLALNALGVIEKPFDPMALGANLNAMLGSRR